MQEQVFQARFGDVRVGDGHVLIRRQAASR
jgi:hypothetical protein